jgi:putative phage-type endonuclease
MNDKLSKLARVHKNYLIAHKLYDTRTLTWDQKRQCGIGGSDIGAICGVNSYKTAYDVFLDKTVGQSFHGNNITWFGSVFEHHIADMFEERYKELFEVKIERKHFKCREYPWLNGNIDRKLIDLKTGEAGVLEIKTTRTFNNDEWGKGCAFGIDYKLIISDNQVPESYYYQVQHYLLCTGFSFAWLCAFSRDTCELRIYKIDADTGVQNLIKKMGTEFWFNHVIKGVEPDRNIPLSERKSNGDTIDADGSIIDKVAALKDLQGKIKDLESQEKALKAEIQAFIGDNEILLDVATDKPLITWKSSEGRTFDTEKFKSEHEDLYNEYLKLVTSRRFTVK